MINPDEARELCSKSEFALLEGSFSPVVETLSASDLKSRIRRVKKLHQNSEDLVPRQHADDRKRTTRRKIELFAEAIGRLETALNLLEAAHRLEPESKSADSEERSDETRALNMAALRERADRELQSRERHVLSAIGVRGEQQGNKSGSKRIQSHVGSAARRQQGRRESKNR